MKPIGYLTVSDIVRLEAARDIYYMPERADIGSHPGGNRIIPVYLLSDIDAIYPGAYDFVDFERSG